MSTQNIQSGGYKPVGGSIKINDEISQIFEPAGGLFPVDTLLTNSTDVRAKKSCDVTTIKLIDGNPIVSVQSINGYYAFELPVAPPKKGKNIHVTGATYPANGVYNIVNTSGNFAITNKKYVECNNSGIVDPGEYTTCTDDMDPPEQREWIIKGVTERLNDENNDILKRINSRLEDKRPVHKFVGVKTRIYTNNWHCFRGEINPCRITVEDTTFWDDQACDGPPEIIMLTPTIKTFDATPPNRQFREVGANNTQNV